jgi:hypothetical protein
MRWRPLSVKVLGYPIAAYSFHDVPATSKGTHGALLAPPAPRVRPLRLLACSSIHMTTDHLVTNVTDGPRHVDGAGRTNLGARRAPLDPLHRRRRRLRGRLAGAGRLRSIAGTRRRRTRRHENRASTLLGPPSLRSDDRSR